MSENLESHFCGNTIRDAEKACFDVLCAIAGWSPGLNAFIGLNPGKPDCAVFDIGEAGLGDTACFQSPTLHFKSYLELFSRDRAPLQAAEVMLYKSFPSGGFSCQNRPEFTDTNVVLFRLSPFQNFFGRITPTTVDGPGGKQWNTNLLQCFLDVVFSV